MELKKYQKNTLETLETFLKELGKVGLKYAFMGLTDKPYKGEALVMFHLFVSRFQRVEVKLL